MKVSLSPWACLTLSLLGLCLPTTLGTALSDASYVNCASISQACFNSQECCSSECHADRHFCCVPQGAQCLGEDGMCCSGQCNPSLGTCSENLNSSSTKMPNLKASLPPTELASSSVSASSRARASFSRSKP